MSMEKVAVVTGASSGIGWAVCHELTEKSWTVYGFSRRGTAPENTLAMSVDITDKASVDAAFERILAEAGHIDLLINAAGMGISGPVEFAHAEDVQRIFDVNFMGQLTCTQAVLSSMRSQKSGRIIFVSSVAAEIAIPYQAFYSASKSALSSLTLALRNEVRDFGISVCAVLPGDAATGFTDAREKDESHDSVYPRNRTATASMEKDERGGMTPEYVAKQIVKAAEKKNPAPLYTIGFKYKIFTVLFRILPGRFSYWIVSKMYS